jgi:hypothetical protein
VCTIEETEPFFIDSCWESDPEAPFISLSTSSYASVASRQLSTGPDRRVLNMLKGKGEIVSSPEQALSAANRLDVEHVSGIVARVTFHSNESGYPMLRFMVLSVRELVMVIGRFGGDSCWSGTAPYQFVAEQRSTVTSFSVSMRRKRNRRH